MVKFQYIILSVIYIGLIVGITYFLVTGINKTPEVAQSYIQPGQAEKLEVSAREQTAENLSNMLFPKLNETVVPQIKQVITFYPPPEYKLKYIKGLTFNPRFDFDIQTDIAAAKSLGANLIVVELELEAVRYNVPDIYLTQGFDAWKPRTIAIINEAHKQSLPVELRTVTRAATDMRIGPYTDNETSAFLNNTLVFFKGLADFAEQYKAARFTLYAETDNQYNWGNRLGDINKVLRDVFEVVDKRYFGKIGVGFTSKTFVDDVVNYDTSGYDYVAISAYPDDPNTNFGFYRNRILESLKAAKEFTYGRQIYEIVLGSFGVNTDSGAPVPFKITKTQQDEADMYENIFVEHANITNGYTVAYDTFMYSVKGKPAEQVVGRWFRGLPN
jgi:hypothetical protein